VTGTAAGPELDFILACAHTRLDQSAMERAGAATGAVIDWSRAFKLAGHHRVFPMVHRVIETQGIATKPEWIARQFATQASRIGQRVATIEAATRDVATTLAAAGIDALVFKGMVTARGCYAVPALRDYSDVDLLVRPEAMERVDALLATHGYIRDFRGDGVERRMYLANHSAYTYRHVDTRIELDVHWHLMPPMWRTSLDLDALWRRARTMTIEGTPLRTFSIDDELLMLALHGSKERWNRLRMVCDVAEHLAAHPDADWAGRLAFARAQGSERSLLLGLAMASAALGAALPAPVERALAQARLGGATDIALRVLGTWRSGGARLGDFSWQRFAALDRPIDRLRYVLRFFACPRMKHLQVVRLPTWAYGLYFPIAIAHEMALLPLWRLWHRLAGKPGIGDAGSGAQGPATPTSSRP
jgi:hypothetical protein